ncbi:sigma 54-interacting transcriptional regulator [Paludibaculum fermentans]|uniref:Sigma 54-interacting transcriptional regulator n=1 Tax=Paludibaculum fermentans TaxID=1473598 RepID=A0A7S7NMP1_PALFE|nr:sigma 54-interacting transcriptional regulator [Paludibaculum fermentans]QOY86416.1 sigma 54-interacting transcriptional regulator [Paludibaculum fermentans]
MDAPRTAPFTTEAPEGTLQTVIDTIPALVWAARPDGSAEFFNQRWLDYAGLSFDDARDWGWTVAVHPDDRPAAIDHWRSILTSGESGEMEARLRRFDGAYRWFLNRASPLRDESGDTVRWYGTSTDIEERKRAEEATRLDEQNLRLVVDSISGLVATMSASGEVLLLNRQNLEYFGKTTEELENWATSDVVHPDDLPGVVAAWQHCFETGEPYDIEHRLRRADGVYRWFHARGLPARDAEGRIVRWHLLLTDVDARRLAEDELAKAVNEIGRLRDRLHDENTYLQDEIRREHNFEEILGNSPELLRLLNRVESAAPTDANVLIIGETGSGKELIARAIHNRSGRKKSPLVKVNCGAIPSGLVESELFGHVRGAFTSASERRIGRFELANNGTLFLDEVGELPLETQVKLLRVLQEQEFEPVGSNHTVKVNVRIIAATNRDLEKAVQAGSFRSDLYYRLNVIPLHVPALRERRSDIPQLVQAFLQKYTKRMGKPIESVSRDAMKLLVDYSWPGNIRELQNVIERGVVLSRGAVLRLGPDLLPTETETSMEAAAIAEDGNSDSLEEVQRQHILRVLEKTDGVISGPRGAGAILDIHPNTLRSLMSRLGIRRALQAAS